jgi:PKHD-type hydroxylase
MIISIPPTQTAGSDNLVYWDNFLTDADIDKILSLSTWHEARPGEVGRDNKATVDLSVRSSQISWMTRNTETEAIWTKIVTLIAEVNRTYFHYDLTGCYEPAQLAIYKATDEGHYNWHCDNAVTDAKVPRKLSMSLMLSDPVEFDGGELQIKTNSDVARSLEQRKGRIWFFPSYTLHRVSPVTRGVRRSLVLWVGGPGFK